VTGVSTVRVEPDETSAEAAFTSTRPLEYVPGIVLLIGVGVLGKYAQIWWNTTAKHHHWTVPDIEYVLWAILIGLAITNTIGLHPVFRPGVLTYQFWLKSGIVALGSRFVLGDILKLGATSLVQILVDMAVAGTVILVVAHAFGLSGKLGSLLAIGTSICGVSAIVAAKGAIRARNADGSYAIAAILALGLFVLPPLGHAIGLSDYQFGLWAGLSVDNTAETTATGYLFSDHAGKIAVLVKSTRNALIGFVVLGFALYWAARAFRRDRSRRQSQGGVHLGEIPEVCPRVPGRLGDRDRALGDQGPNGQPCQRVEMGIPTHLRRRRPDHRHPRNRAHRVAAARCRGHRAHRRRTGLAGTRAAYHQRVSLGCQHLGPGQGHKRRCDKPVRCIGVL